MEIGYLYVNGLNDGQTKPHDKLAIWWWKRKSMQLRHAHIDWFDTGDLDTKIGTVTAQVDQMLEQFGAVTLLGVSAGGSLALNAFHQVRDKKVCLVMAHARLGIGDYASSNSASLHRRAHMDTDNGSAAFVDSVTSAERAVIPNLSAAEKQRMLTLSTLADAVVPSRLMTIYGVANHRSLTASHTGGFLAHMLADRNLIRTFAEQTLSQ